MSGEYKELKVPHLGSKLHIPIIQYLIVSDCPNCGSDDIDTLGTITDPPIAMQLSDSNKGIIRNWQASRKFCKNCENVYDHVEINNFGDVDIADIFSNSQQ